MEEFAKLVDSLYFLNSNVAKSKRLIEYLRDTPDPDRGYAIAAIANTLDFEFFKRRMIKDAITERIDPVLFDLSYDYVGEMSETVAHLWSTTIHENIDVSESNQKLASLPSLSEVISTFASLPKNKTKQYLVNLLDIMSPTQRWALLKLGTGGLRIGMSARFLKKVLVEYANQLSNDLSIEDIERIWHGVTPPYLDLLSYIEGKGPVPDIKNKLTFQPVMLSHPLNDDDIGQINPSEWQAEWKFDGIRAQLLSNNTGVALYSRTGDDISNSFPEIIEAIAHSSIKGRFDGELLAMKYNKNEIDSSDSLNRHEQLEIPSGVDDQSFDQNSIQSIKNAIKAYAHVASFNQLQQRLNKKKPSKKLIETNPTGLILYDALEVESDDVRMLTLQQRTEKLTLYLKEKSAERTHFPLYASTEIAFKSSSELVKLKTIASELSGGYIEGLMLKKKSSTYVSGRPKGQWYKLKRDPKLIDAVIMYAQRGHGKRSSFYSDYTFGCWQDNQLLPIGKAYSGFTDEELKKLDNWVRRNTVGRFGPVKEVKKDLVFELAFDSVARSNRHKSKVALRFPRIHRIRWDKPASEADNLATLIEMIES